MSTKPKIIFLGTPEVAAETLSYLLQNGVVIAAVITRPDKPSGRSKLMTSPPVKVVAREAELTIFQPSSKDELLQALKQTRPDLMITVAFGMILTQEMLDIPSFGTLNLHFSLLPLYRGAAPYIDTILNGDKETGVSIAQTVLALDEGDIVASEKYPLRGDETAASLLPSLTKVGSKLLLATIHLWLDGKIIPEKQSGTPSYTRKIVKEAGHIDWQDSAINIERMTRAYYPWPSAFTFNNDKRVKIITANVSEKALAPGTTQLENQRLYVGTGTTALEIVRLQPEGKAEMPTSDFLRGAKTASTLK